MIFEIAFLRVLYKQGKKGWNQSCNDMPELKTDNELEQWEKGGETTRTLVPLGYAGNPVGYKNIVNIDCIEKFTVEYTVKQIIESLSD